MANYYISLKRYLPINSELIFFGPFDRKQDADSEIENVKKEADFEIVTDENVSPKDFARAVLVEVLTQTAARRSGMKSTKIGDKKDTLIGATIPTRAEDIGLSPSNGKTIVTPIPDKNKSSNYLSVVKESESEDDILTDFEKSEAIIVTPHISNIDWLRQQGIHGEATMKARPEQIEGKTVVGKLTYRLGVLDKRVGAIDIAKLRVTQSGQTLNTKELYEADAKLRWYRVIEEMGDWRKLFLYLDKNPRNLKKILELIEKE